MWSIPKKTQNTHTYVYKYAHVKHMPNHTNHGESEILCILVLHLLADHFPFMAFADAKGYSFSHGVTQLPEIGGESRRLR